MGSRLFCPVKKGHLYGYKFWGEMINGFKVWGCIPSYIFTCYTNIQKRIIFVTFCLHPLTLKPSQNETKAWLFKASLA